MDKKYQIAKLAITDSLAHSVFPYLCRDINVNLERGAVSKFISSLCLLRINQPTERHITLGKEWNKQFNI